MAERNLNPKHVPRIKSKYDEIADIYDSLFTDEQSLAEDAEVGMMLQPVLGSVLDIGCGTGLLTEIIDIEPSRYCGVDPSEGMLLKFKIKHPLYTNLICSEFDGDLIEYRKFDNIVALFGSASYLSDKALSALASFNNKKFLMFYKDTYHPVTYEKCGVEFEHSKLSSSQLSGIFYNDTVVEFNNYLIVK